MIILPEWLQDWLAKQPEYGMGYQKVSATLGTGAIEKGLVLNAQVFVKDNESSLQLFYNDWGLVLEEAKKSALSIRHTDLIPRAADTLRGVRTIVIANSKSAVLSESQQFSARLEGAAKYAVVTQTVLGNIFKRFSAYADDRRVTAMKGLTAGTFATTKEDADAHIKTGADAVCRYALENKKPASNVFTIAPPKDTNVKRGVVEPAHSEAGGGVEIIFVNGAPDGTVSGPESIPDK